MNEALVSLKLVLAGVFWLAPEGAPYAPVGNRRQPAAGLHDPGAWTTRC